MEAASEIARMAQERYDTESPCSTGPYCDEICAPNVEAFDRHDVTMLYVGKRATWAGERAAWHAKSGP